MQNYGLVLHEEWTTDVQSKIRYPTKYQISESARD